MLRMCWNNERKSGKEENVEAGLYLAKPRMDMSKE